MSVLLSGLDFNSGAVAEISLSDRTLSLVVLLATAPSYPSNSKVNG